MKIEYVKGDLFTHPFGDEPTEVYIAHVCNDKRAWGSGFVIPLGKFLPEAMDGYLGSQNLEMGQTQFVVSTEKKAVVCNMIAQTLGGKRPLRYDKLVKCMESVADRIITQVFLRPANFIHTNPSLTPGPINKIICPLFGSDRAGGDWNFIEALINDIWISKNIPVTVYYLEQFLPSNWNPPENPGDYQMIRYRWNYSEGHGVWFYRKMASDMSKSQINDEMKYIEQSDGHREATHWSGFEWEFIPANTVVCEKCAKLEYENKAKYCGHGNDKNTNHRWRKLSEIPYSTNDQFKW